MGRLPPGAVDRSTRASGGAVDGRPGTGRRRAALGAGDPAGPRPVAGGRHRGLRGHVARLRGTGAVARCPGRGPAAHLGGPEIPGQPLSRGDGPARATARPGAARPSHRGVPARRRRPGTGPVRRRSRPPAPEPAVRPRLRRRPPRPQARAEHRRAGRQRAPPRQRPCQPGHRCPDGPGERRRRPVLLRPADRAGLRAGARPRHGRLPGLEEGGPGGAAGPSPRGGHPTRRLPPVLPARPAGGLPPPARTDRTAGRRQPARTRAADGRDRPGRGRLRAAPQPAGAGARGPGADRPAEGAGPSAHQ